MPHGRDTCITRPSRTELLNHESSCSAERSAARLTLHRKRNAPCVECSSLSMSSGLASSGMSAVSSSRFGVSSKGFGVSGRGIGMVR